MGDFMERLEQVNKLGGKLANYASLQADMDLGDTRYQAMKGEVQSFMVDLGAKLAFMEPELLELGEAKVEAYIQADPRLGPHRVGFLKILRMKDHILPEGEARVVATGGPVRPRAPRRRRPAHRPGHAPARSDPVHRRAGAAEHRQLPEAPRRQGGRRPPAGDGDLLDQPEALREHPGHAAGRRHQAGPLPRPGAPLPHLPGRRPLSGRHRPGRSTATWWPPCAPTWPRCTGCCACAGGCWACRSCATPTCTPRR